MPKRWWKHWWLWAALSGILLVALILLFQTPERVPNRRSLSYSQMLALQDKLKVVVIRGDELTGRDEDGHAFVTTLPADPAIATRLAERGIDVDIVSTQDQPGSASAFVTWLPSLIYIIYLIVLVVPLYRIARALEARAERPPKQVAASNPSR